MCSVAFLCVCYCFLIHTFKRFSPRTLSACGPCFILVPAAYHFTPCTSCFLLNRLRCNNTIYLQLPLCLLRHRKYTYYTTTCLFRTISRVGPSDALRYIGTDLPLISSLNVHLFSCYTYIPNWAPMRNYYCPCGEKSYIRSFNLCFIPNCLFSF